MEKTEQNARNEEEMSHSTLKVCPSINNCTNNYEFELICIFVVPRHFVFETSHLMQAVPSILAIS